MGSDVVLITGAAGFVGARMVEFCRSRGLLTISVDRFSHFDSRSEHSGIDFGKRVDRDELFEWLRRERPRLRAIVHLGACTDTTCFDESFLRRVNLEYSKRVWDYAAKNQVPLVYASSAATYGDGALGYSDDEALIPRLKPLNPYGESKRLFDLWALEQEKTGSAPPTWAGFKFFNVYGLGERHKKKMSSVVLQAYDQILEKGRVRLFRSHQEGVADGEQKRDFVYVDDVVDVLWFAIQSPIERGIFNLGSGKARSFLDLARATFQALGRREEIEWVDTPVEIRDKYQYFTQAELSRLRSAGYAREMTELEDGVRMYVERLRAAHK